MGAPAGRSHIISLRSLGPRWGHQDRVTPRSANKFGAEVGPASACVFPPVPWAGAAQAVLPPVPDQAGPPPRVPTVTSLYLLLQAPQRLTWGGCSLVQPVAGQREPQRWPIREAGPEEAEFGPEGLQDGNSRSKNGTVE